VCERSWLKPSRSTTNGLRAFDEACAASTSVRVARHSPEAGGSVNTGRLHAIYASYGKGLEFVELHVDACVRDSCGVNVRG
jgi:hypothetical protein